MRKEYINPIIKAAIDVLRITTGLDYSIGEPEVYKVPVITDHIVIGLGITGDISGQTFLTMKDDVAKKVASGMMMGMPVNEIDTMAKSAISELGNMIMGNAATLLYNAGVTVDITTPSLIIGNDIEISSIKTETIMVPILSDDTVIKLVISAKV